MISDLGLPSGAAADVVQCRLGAAYTDDDHSMEGGIRVALTGETEPKDADVEMASSREKSGLPNKKGGSHRWKPPLSIGPMLVAFAGRRMYLAHSLI
jgi:hypothetical protein